jgi:hypothetical protein
VPILAIKAFKEGDGNEWSASLSEEKYSYPAERMFSSCPQSFLDILE